MKDFEEEIVKVNWNDKDSIQQAENHKEDLEASGYEYIQTISGVNCSKLIYRNYK